MSFDGLIDQTREALREVLPEGVEVTDIELEGPHIVLYTKQLDSVPLRRRPPSADRPATAPAASWSGRIPSILMDPKLAEAQIRALIPAGGRDQPALLRARDRGGHRRGGEPRRGHRPSGRGAERPQAEDRVDPHRPADPADPLEDRRGGPHPPAQRVRRPPVVPEEDGDPHRPGPAPREDLGPEQRLRRLPGGRPFRAPPADPELQDPHRLRPRPRARTARRSSTPPSSSPSTPWTPWSSPTPTSTTAASSRCC